MPEVTQTNDHPDLKQPESGSPEIEALPGAGDKVIFVEDGNAEGWLSFDPEGVPEIPQR